MAVQPPISTIHCICLYSLANSGIHSFMLSSPNPQISSSILTAFSLTSSFSFTSSTSFTSQFCFTQTIPTFSTPSKHHAHTNTYNSIPFMRLLHTSRHHRGGGYVLSFKSSFHCTSSFQSNSRLALPISAPSLFSFFAAKCTKLTPLFSNSSALFKKECLPKPFSIKAFRTLSQNTRGVPSLLLSLSTGSVHLFTTFSYNAQRFFLFLSAVSCELHCQLPLHNSFRCH